MNSAMTEKQFFIYISKHTIVLTIKRRLTNEPKWEWKMERKKNVYTPFECLETHPRFHFVSHSSVATNNEIRFRKYRPIFIKRIRSQFMIVNTKIKDNEAWQSSVIIINLHWKFIDFAREPCLQKNCRVLLRWRNLCIATFTNQIICSTFSWMITRVTFTNERRGSRFFVGTVNSKVA